MPEGRRIAYFVSSHGLGHAARASGVMAALHELDPSIRFEVFTSVPTWFFRDSLAGSFACHSLVTDVGLVQKTPLHEDLPETLKRLDGFLPFDRSRISGLAEMIKAEACELIICDIAPMGIAVAQAAGIPSVLVENFTWDWIYGRYPGHSGRMGQHAEYLRGLFEAVDYRIQAEPVCIYRRADLITPPISRKIRTPRREIRRTLRIPEESPAVMITMGGTLQEYTFLEILKGQTEVYFVIPGGSSSVQAFDNILLLPNDSGLFHPDLVNACDAVVGKVGYSTLAEVYYAGVPFGYITRPAFAESEALAAYIGEHMAGFAISETQFREGAWVRQLSRLLALPAVRPRGPHGAAQAASFILKILKGKGKGAG